MNDTLPTIEENEIYRLLKENGIPNDLKCIKPLTGGRNNRIFYLKNSVNSFVLKKYLSNNSEHLRKKVDIEFDFLKKIYTYVPKIVPRPYAKNSEEGIALYEYIPGQKIKNPSELKYTYIEQAAKFIYEINKNINSSDTELELAADFSDSIADHIFKINNRFDKLKQFANDKNLLCNVISEMEYKWKIIQNNIYSKCKKNNIDIYEIIKNEDKILSPSDFGFHNAILKEDDSVTFIDYEYAGFDDPVKLVGDFFTQIEVPVDEKYIYGFINMIAKNDQTAQQILTKIEILLDSFKMKWCCIALNVFLRDNLERILFANPELNLKQYQYEQLLKVKNLIKKVDI